MITGITFLQSFLRVSQFLTDASLKNKESVEKVIVRKCDFLGRENEGKNQTTGNENEEGFYRWKEVKRVPGNKTRFVNLLSFSFAKSVRRQMVCGHVEF